MITPPTYNWMPPRRTLALGMTAAPTPVLENYQPYRQQFNQAPPKMQGGPGPSYFNDPTLAAGFGGGGSSSYTAPGYSSPPDGAMPIPWGGRIPLHMWKKGWRGKRIGNQMYMLPPGNEPQPMPNDVPYGFNY